MKTNKLRYLREKKGLSRNEVAEVLGIKPRTYMSYENMEREPNSEMLISLANYFDVTIDYLIGRVNISTRSNLPEPTVTEEYTTFPVIGEVAAGYESVADENWIGDTVDIPLSYLQGHNRTDFFVLKVKGDSMYPLYHDADKVLILKQSTMNYSGQIGVVIYGDDKGTIKRVEYSPGEDWMKLVPVNPNFPTVKIENEELEHCRVLGIPQLLIRDLKE